jgi:hypothetical protein
MYYLCKIQLVDHASIGPITFASCLSWQRRPPPHLAKPFSGHKGRRFLAVLIHERAEERRKFPAIQSHLSAVLFRSLWCSPSMSIFLGSGWHSRITISQVRNHTAPDTTLRAGTMNLPVAPAYTCWSTWEAWPVANITSADACVTYYNRNADNTGTVAIFVKGIGRAGN